MRERPNRLSIQPTRHLSPRRQFAVHPHLSPPGAFSSAVAASVVFGQRPAHSPRPVHTRSIPPHAPAATIGRSPLLTHHMPDHVRQGDLMKTLIVAAALPLFFACPAFAQTGPYPRSPETTGTVITGVPNTTGNSRSRIIAPGATGAETITTDSAAGGNAGQPSRRVPQGGAGSGGHGGSQ
jgi:hypothetical protein